MSNQIIIGDCREVLAGYEAGTFHAVVTDPPYELNFMGRGWDNAGVSFDPETWRAVYRVLKPGGHLLAFGGSRTFHRIAVAIEDAGFEIRDTLSWLYATGFPKSLNLDRAGAFCACGESPSVVPLAYGDTAPKHNMRPVRGADLQASLDVEDQRGQVLLSGVPEPGAPGNGVAPTVAAQTRQEQSGMEGRGYVLPQARKLQADQVRPVPGIVSANGSDGPIRDGASAADGNAVRLSALADGGGSPSESRPAGQRRQQSRTMAYERQPQGGGAWPDCLRCDLPVVPKGLGTALKPAWEPIIMARKPFKGTVAANVMAHGTGAINVDGCRVGSPDNKRSAGSKRYTPSQFAGREPGDGGERLQQAPHDGMGRWPPNVAMDEDAAALLDEMSGERKSPGDYKRNPVNRGEVRTYGMGAGIPDMETHTGYDDTGGASRFMKVVMHDPSAGRWPPNVAMDEDAAALLDEMSGKRKSGGSPASWGSGSGETASESGKSYYSGLPVCTSAGYHDTGGASRFMYVAKASRSERNAGLDGMPEQAWPEDHMGYAARRCRACGKWFPKPMRDLRRPESTCECEHPEYEKVGRPTAANHHPTVKPVALMRWLVRMVTPADGHVLDPFMGSGSTGIAAVLEGFDFTGVDLSEEYAEIARRRIAHAGSQPALFR